MGKKKFCLKCGSDKMNKGSNGWFRGKDGALYNVKERTVETFYITYGLGSNLANCYSEVQGATYAEARSIVDEVTGGKFAFMYDHCEFLGQPEKYGLVKVDLQPQVNL